MKTLNFNPTAKVAIKGNVLKQYKVDNVDTVFLKDNTEFQIELFNPLQETVMCKITLNGKQQSDNLVLYPGQRIFLERYLDSNQKFLFKTYEVTNNPEVDYATKNNGELEIEFFKEILFNNISYTNTFYYQGSPTVTYNSDTTGAFTINPVTNYTKTSFCNSNITEEKTKETGVISKGEKSNQNFSYVYNDFSITPFTTIKIKILPDSQKTKSIEDLKYKKYCSNCGKKVNHKDNFCSYCGNKL